MVLKPLRVRLTSSGGVSASPEARTRPRGTYFFSRRRRLAAIAAAAPAPSTAKVAGSGTEVPPRPPLPPPGGGGHRSLPMIGRPQRNPPPPLPLAYAGLVSSAPKATAVARLRPSFFMDRPRCND
jgi:hypothetical protein